jgi:hypothetical protein
MSIKTLINWGYMPTEAQTSATREKLESLGYLYCRIMPDDQGNIVREWNTEQDATAYLDLVKTFDPQPISAKLIVE